MPSREQVEQLIDMVEQGRFVEAMRRFYADDASMQENQDAPRRGLPQLLAHERNVLLSCEKIAIRPVSFFAISGDNVVIHWIFDMLLKNGHRFSLDEMAHQRWQDGKIVEEKFYYDPAQRLGKPASTST